MNRLNRNSSFLASWHFDSVSIDMAELHELAAVYLRLAWASERRHRPLVRDKLLVLGGACASMMGEEAAAEDCRTRILANNTGHMLRRFESFAEALTDPDFRHYLDHLEKRYSLEKGEMMLEQLAVSLPRRVEYSSDAAFLAALLEVDPDEL